VGSGLDKTIKEDITNKILLKIGNPEFGEKTDGNNPEVRNESNSASKRTKERDTKEKEL